MRQLKIEKSITIRDGASLEKYLQEIGRVPRVTAEEEVKLAVLIRMGNQEALARLVNANLRFVVSVAKQYQNQGLSLLDLINDGNLGLVKAARRFDETRGFKFISYGVWWIRQSIMQALSETSRIIRLPVNRIEQVDKILKATEKLEHDLERQPTKAELEQILGENIEDIYPNMMARAPNQVLYLDEPIGENSADTRLDSIGNKDDSISPDNFLLSESLYQDLGRSLNFLGPTEREVLKLFYGLGGELPHTTEEIAQRYELTQSRIRQIKDAAIIRLRNRLRSTNLLRNYLG